MNVGNTTINPSVQISGTSYDDFINQINRIQDYFTNFVPNVNVSTGTFSVFDDINKINRSKQYEQRVDKIIKCLSSEIEDEIIMLEGLILELQRRVDEPQGDDPSLLKDIGEAINSIDKVMKRLNGTLSEIDYMERVINGIKVSHELSLVKD